MLRQLLVGTLLLGGSSRAIAAAAAAAAAAESTEDAIQIDNYASASEQPGATALVPKPGKLFLRMEARHPYLAPLPADRGQGEAKWYV